MNHQNLDISISVHAPLSYGGHDIHFTQDDGVGVWCPKCDIKHSFEQDITGVREWVALFYLVGRYPDECDGSMKRVEEQVEDVVSQHIGKPITNGNIQSIRQDIEASLGDEVIVEITT